MATKRMETQLTIRAVDKFSGMLKGMSATTGKFADRVRRDMAGLQRLRGPLKLIEDFRKQQDVVRKSGAALDAAREKQRRLLTQIKATKTPTAQMRREFDQARNAVTRLEGAHTRHRRALHGLQTQLRRAGVNTADLSGEQRRLAGAIDAGTSAFDRQIAKMRRVERMQKTLAEAREVMDRSLARAANLSFVGGAASQTGRRMLEGLRSPIGKAVDFETAMSDVRKVVDFDSPEGFRQMSDDILKLSSRIPMTAEGLAQIVAAGGQASIPREELLKFAEMAAKIGVAFDVSADMAGESMAKIRTGLGLSLDDTGALFDAINHLSNNMASEAPSLVDFMRRAGGDGKAAGFNAEEMVAFGSAMVASGAQADVAATSFRNMAKRLARGEAATKGQAKAFKALGLEATQVAKNLQQDAVATTMDVLNRIKALPDFQQSSVMSQLFGDEARALSMLIGNLDTLETALGHVRDAQTYAGSADAEYAQRAQTTANNLQLMQNQLSRMGVTIGEAVLPAMNDLLTKSQAIVEAFTNWIRQNPQLTKALVIGTAALGAMAVAGGALLTAAAGLVGTMAVLRFGLVGLGARALFAAGSLGGIGRAMGALGKIPKLALSKLIVPLKWTASLIPFLSMSTFKGLATGGKMFGLKGLVTALKWTSRLIPGIGWAVLAGELAWNLLLKKLPWSDWIDRIDFGEYITWPEPPAWLKWLMGQDDTDAVPGFDGLDADTQGATRTLLRYEGADALPTADRMAALREEAAAWRGEVEAARAALDAVPDFGNGMPNPLRVQAETDLALAEAGLARAEEKMASAERAAVELTTALQVVDGTSAAPEISTASIDRALTKVQQLAQQLRSLPSAGTPGVAAPKPAGKRAGGGPVRAGLSYLVNENTPRSEWFVPSKSGGVLNVGQAKSAFRGHLAAMAAGSGRVRAAGLAAATAGALAVPAAAGGAGGKGQSVRVEVNGGIHVSVPSGMTNPEAIADFVADRLGQRVAATMSASFSD